jgi:serine protease Do
MGVGFAVPVNLARGVMEQLIKGGKVVRGFLGVHLQDLTSDLAKEFNTPDSGGVLVTDVEPGSPAERAGLKPRDVITSLDGKPVTDGRGLKLMVGRMAPGAKAEVKVLRDGKEKDFTVTLKEFTDKDQASAKGGHEAENPDELLKGVGVTDLTPDVRQQLEIPASVQGALVTEVDPESVAAEKGLRVGDVIQEINHKPIKNAEDAEAVTQHVKDKKALVRVWSHGNSRYVVVDESETQKEK